MIFFSDKQRYTKIQSRLDAGTFLNKVFVFQCDHCLQNSWNNMDGFFISLFFKWSQYRYIFFSFQESLHGLFNVYAKIKREWWNCTTTRAYMKHVSNESWITTKQKKKINKNKNHIFLNELCYIYNKIHWHRKGLAQKLKYMIKPNNLPQSK